MPFNCLNYFVLAGAVVVVLCCCMYVYVCVYELVLCGGIPV